MGDPLKFPGWIGARVALAGLILGLVLTACAFWLALRDGDHFEETRRDRLNSLAGERAKVQTELGEIHQRMAKTTATIATAQARIKQTESVIAQLRALDSTWGKLTGDAQQKANTERREKLEMQNVDSTAQVAALQSDYTRTGWERDGREIELAKLDAQLSAEAHRSKMGHFFGEAWNYPLGWLRAKGWVALLLGLFCIGTTAFKLAGGRRLR